MICLDICLCGELPAIRAHVLFLRQCWLVHGVPGSCGEDSHLAWLAWWLKPGQGSGTRGAELRKPSFLACFQPQSPTDTLGGI